MLLNIHFGTFCFCTILINVLKKCLYFNHFYIIWIQRCSSRTKRPCRKHLVRQMPSYSFLMGMLRGEQPKYILFFLSFDYVSLSAIWLRIPYLTVPAYLWKLHSSFSWRLGSLLPETLPPDYAVCIGLCHRLCFLLLWWAFLASFWYRLSMLVLFCSFPL